MFNLTHSDRFSRCNLGLVIDNKFNGKDDKRGLFFTTIDNVFKEMNGNTLRRISIPNDAEVVAFEKKSKANKIFVEQIIVLDNQEIWSDEKFCLNAVKQNGLIIQFIDISNQTDAVCMEAVKQNGLALKHLHKQTDDLCIEAVRQTGWALEYVREQTDALCIEAVKQCGFALKFVKNQTKEICLQAVQQKGLALQFVKNQTEEICLQAIKENKFSFSFVRNKTKAICDVAGRDFEI